MYPLPTQWIDSGLLDPKGNPGIGLKIDWGHSLALGLEVLCAFQRGIPYDLVTEMPLADNGNRGAIDRELIDGVHLNSSAIFYWSHKNIVIPNTDKWALTFELELEGTEVAIVGSAPGNVGDNYFWCDTGSYLRRKNDAGSLSEPIGAGADFGTRKFYTVSCDTPGAAVSLTAYEDGVDVTNTQGVDSAHDFEAFGGGFPNATFSIDGKIYYWMLHSRNLSKWEAEAIMNDPLQMCVPR